MDTNICTLFEGDYHYGLAALINSLYQHNFRGSVWVGYRGNLPPWVHSTRQYPEYTEFEAIEGCSIRFIPLTIDYHFTNYKPDFMLYLWEHYCPETDALFYFDPDIVVLRTWSHFEDWVTHGVALCEDINSPIPDSHPKRGAWRRYFAQLGYELSYSTSIYVNGGFIGVSKENREFLRAWQKFTELIAPLIGGLQSGAIAADYRVKSGDLFDKGDQDTLNIAIMSSTCPVSLIGKEGMQFKLGNSLMSHAIGKEKPWRKRMALNALRGRRISWADRSFLQYTQSPIQLYSPLQHKAKTLDLCIARVLNRVY